MIYNKHNSTEIPANAVLVDRTTKYGNPHRMRLATRSERAKAMLFFCEYLLRSPALITDIRTNLKDKDLVCWCVPLYCHAEILQGVADAADPYAFIGRAIRRLVDDVERGQLSVYSSDT